MDVIDSISFNGFQHILSIPYAECSTSAATVTKTVTFNNFSQATSGSIFAVRFIYGNTANNPSLNVNDTTGCPLYYKGSQIKGGDRYILPNNTYLITWYSGHYELIGNINSIGESYYSETDGVGGEIFNDYTNNVASHTYSHAEGWQTTASGIASHAEGYGTSATNECAHASGLYTRAQGEASFTMGAYTTAKTHQLVLGHYNISYTGLANGSTSNTALIIGNGKSGSTQNALRVLFNGTVRSNGGSYETSGADYAEYFEWQDSNPNSEDRRSYFVTLDGDKIKIAEPEDYILGIVSGQPSVIGNGDECWRGRYILDEFGSRINEEYEYEEEEPIEIVDEETGETRTEMRTVKKTSTKYKENPDYDPTIPYIQREDRPEWDAVGMLGVLAVRDDGTCKVNGYCACAEGGIATASDTGYRVIKRVNDHIVKIVLK